jgi:adenosine/AMP kinase
MKKKERMNMGGKQWTPNFTVVEIEKPEPLTEIIVFQGNFAIFLIDDLALRLKLANPSIKFGFGMNGSHPPVTRVTGNSDKLIELATKYTSEIGAGHAGVIFVRDAKPSNILNAIKSHPVMCHVWATSHNSMDVIVGETKLGKAIVAVVDGPASTGIETDSEIDARKTRLSELGYELG